MPKLNPHFSRWTLKKKGKEKQENSSKHTDELVRHYEEEKPGNQKRVNRDHRLKYSNGGLIHKQNPMKSHQNASCPPQTGNNKNRRSTSRACLSQEFALAYRRYNRTQPLGWDNQTASVTDKKGLQQQTFLVIASFRQGTNFVPIKVNDHHRKQVEDIVRTAL